MSSTLDMLLTRYGPTMGVPELAEVLKVKPKTIWTRARNNGGEFEVPSRKIGQRRIFATTDVAQYLEAQSNAGS